MDRERVTRWIQALRSGQYQQTQQRLRHGDRFCCLGVGCDLYEPDAWAMVPRNDRDDVYSFRYQGRDWVTWMPKGVREWFGLSQEDHDRLVQMNDSGKSFSEIADWLAISEPQRKQA